MNNHIILSLKEKIEDHHKLYPNIPIKDVYWESILSSSLKDNKHVHEWELGSHKIETDISTEEFGNISCKSGKLNKLENVLTVSGSRTTRFKSLDEKIEFLSDKKSDYMYCLTYNKNHYMMYMFNTNIFNFQDKIWCESDSGWHTIDRDSKLKIKIVKAMSDQIWMDIPVDLAEKIYGLPIQTVE